MPFFYKGSIIGVRSGVYEKRTYAALQCMDEQPDGSVKFFEINLPDDYDHKRFHKGQHVELKVALWVRASDRKLSIRLESDAKDGADPSKGPPKPS